MSVVKVKINNKISSLWNEFSIIKELPSMSNVFTLSAPNIYTGNPDDWNLLLDDECTITVDDLSLCTGWVDQIIFDYVPGSSPIVIVGRDKVSDLIDCPYGTTPNEWKNQSIRSIFQILCHPFDISVTFDSSVSSIVSQTINIFKSDEGETVFALISRICNDYGMLPISKGDGKLTIIRPNPTTRATDILEIGKNVGGFSFTHSNVDRYSKYIIKGIGQGSDTKQLSDFVEPYGEATDSLISRYRPCVLFSNRDRKSVV